MFQTVWNAEPSLASRKRSRNRCASVKMLYENLGQIHREHVAQHATADCRGHTEHTRAKDVHFLFHRGQCPRKGKGNHADDFKNKKDRVHKSSCFAEQSSYANSIAQPKAKSNKNLHFDEMRLHKKYEKCNFFNILSV